MELTQAVRPYILILELKTPSKQIHRVYVQTPADFFDVSDAVDVGDEFVQAFLQVAAFVALE